MSPSDIGQFSQIQHVCMSVLVFLACVCVSTCVFVCVYLCAFVCMYVRVLWAEKNLWLVFALYRLHKLTFYVLVSTVTISVLHDHPIIPANLLNLIWDRFSVCSEWTYTTVQCRPTSPFSSGVRPISPFCY